MSNDIDAEKEPIKEKEENDDAVIVNPEKDIDIDVNEQNEDEQKEDDDEPEDVVQAALEKSAKDKKEIKLDIQKVASAIGVFSLVVLVLLISGDELWTATDTSFGWHWMRMKYTGVSDEVDGSRKAWLAMGILSVFSLAAAVGCLKYDDEIIEKAKEKITKPVLNWIIISLFITSAVFLFIGCCVVAAVDNTGGTLNLSLDLGGSPIVGFIMTVVMIVPAGLLYYKNKK